MSQDGSVPNEEAASYRTERVIASLVMAWVVILTTYMILQNQKLSPESMYFLKIILSLSGAVMLATLPGFLDINYSLSGFSVRAAGGAAAFVFIYTQSPSIPALKLETAPNPPIDIRRTVPSPSPTGQLSNRADGLPVLVALSFDPLAFFLADTDKSSEIYAIHSAGHDESSTILNSNVQLASLGFGSILLMGESGSGPSALVSSIISVLRKLAGSLVAILDMAADLLRAGVDHIAGFADNLVTQLNSLVAIPIDQLTVLTETVESTVDRLSADVVAPVIISVEGTVGGLMNDIGDTVGGLTETVLGTIGGVTDLTGDLLGVTQNVVDDVTGSVIPTVNGIVNNVTPQLEKITHQLNEVAPALIIKLDENLPLESSLILGPQTVQAVTENLSLQPLDRVLEGAHIGNLTNALNGSISFDGQGVDRLTGPILGNVGGACNALGCVTGVLNSVPERINTPQLVQGLTQPLTGAGGLLRPVLGGASADGGGAGDSGLGGGSGISLGAPILSSPGSDGPASTGGGVLSSTLETTKNTVGGLTKALGGKR